MTEIEGISTWMQCAWSNRSRVNTQNQETVAITPTAESKRIFKSETALKWRWTTVQCNVCFSWSGVYIDIYIFKYPVRWQKLLGSARSGSTALGYRNCVITLVGGWWRLCIARAFTRCMIKKIKTILLYTNFETSAIAVIWNTSCKKCIFWARDMKSIFFLIISISASRTCHLFF